MIASGLRSTNFINRPPKLHIKAATNKIRCAFDKFRTYFSFTDSVMTNSATGSSPNTLGTVAVTGTGRLTRSPVSIALFTASLICFKLLQEKRVSPSDLLIKSALRSLKIITIFRFFFSFVNTLKIRRPNQLQPPWTLYT